jgi:Ca-activated chloride channel family protein
VVVAVDLSMSMAAEDVGTSRAQRASEVVARLNEGLPSERVGVAVFADWPYTLLPLTDDPGLVRFFATSLSPRLVAERDQGTDLGAVLVHARRTLDARRRPDAQGLIVLVSDGEVHGDPSSVLDSARVAAGEGLDGVWIWTAGVGSAAGGVIPLGDEEGSLLLDESGAPALARFDEGVLREVARAGGGGFYDVSTEVGLARLVEDLTLLTGLADRDLEVPPLAVLLALLALPALLWEGLADSGRPGRRRRAARAYS